MTTYNRKAIGARASAIYRDAKSSNAPLTWAAAQKLAWAEAKSVAAPIVVAGKRKQVAIIDGAQPGGVVAAMARYGVRIDAISDRVAQFREHLVEVMRNARREYAVLALQDDRGVINARRDGAGEWRV